MMVTSDPIGGRHGLRSTYIAGVQEFVKQMSIPNAHDRVCVCSVEQDIRYLDAEIHDLSRAYISGIEVRGSTKRVANRRPRR